MTKPSLYGIVGEFDGPATLVDAARALHEQGFRKMEAYSPYPLHQLEEVIEAKRRLPLVVLLGGLMGALTAWAMQFYIAVFDYPTNIGGRPLNSWPSFIVIMFELTILFAAVSAFFGALGMSRFPRLHHPIFTTPKFKEATNNRFFLCVESVDPLFDQEALTDLFARMAALEVSAIEND